MEEVAGRASNQGLKLPETLKLRCLATWSPTPRSDCYWAQPPLLRSGAMASSAVQHRPDSYLAWCLIGDHMTTSKSVVPWIKLSLLEAEGEALGSTRSGLLLHTVYDLLCQGFVRHRSEDLGLRTYRYNDHEQTAP